MIFIIGLEIEGRIKAQSGLVDNDEKLDTNDIFDLQRLMLSHNIYINCFSNITSLIKDIEASVAIYQKVDVAGKTLPGLILRGSLHDETFLEIGTAKTIQRSLSCEATGETVESKGLVAIRSGLLRGLLHAAGGHILTGIEKVIGKAIIDVSAKSLVEILRAEGSFAAAITFLEHQATNLLQLSEKIPIYFGYVRGLLVLLGFKA